MRINLECDLNSHTTLEVRFVFIPCAIIFEAFTAFCLTRGLSEVISQFAVSHDGSQPLHLYTCAIRTQVSIVKENMSERYDFFHKTR